MKKINLILVTLVFAFILSCEKNTDVNELPELPCSYNDFRYYNSRIEPLGQMSGEYILIGSDSSISDKLIRDFIKSKDIFNQSYDFKIHSDINYPYKYAGLKLNKNCSCGEISWILNDLKRNSIISFAHYTTQTNDCNNLIWEPIGNLCVNSYSNIFYVKVKNPGDLSDLNKILIDTHTRIRGQDQFMKDWYSIFADKNSQGDALEMANYFYETGLFAASEPDIIKFFVE